MNSSRNLFIVGLSLFFGLSMPEWMSSHHNTIHTGVPEIDQILTVLLSTGMFVGGVVGFTLDNIIPGSEEERGLKAWRNIFHNDDAKEMTLDCYDFPWCMGCISRVKFFRYFPICPTFNYSPSSSSCCRKANSYPVDTPL
ncbi:hypothetical protein LSH36_1893g00002 [Paralvinella palmiformis]|uniref:Uncharacterized protein n=1 Tax=Paralvinella palmiformis TaxID=53620 RepID=A0AAD9IRM5_9ANNE|nr:hypothetical protein LSH36_1893g00002 [Paralvinella palmiformis]